MIPAAIIDKLTASWNELTAKVKNLWRPAWKILSMPLMEGIAVPEKAFSVSIEHGSLWVASGSRFLSRIRIKGFKRYVFEEGRYPGPESLASTVSLAMKEMKAGRTAITLSIPRDWAAVRTVNFPAVVKENLTGVVAYELDRFTPFSADNAYYDFKVSDEQQDRLSLVVTAARSDLINRYLDRLREESIGVERVTVNLSGIGTLCSYLSGGKDSVCLEADSQGYEVGLVRRNTLVSFSRGNFNGSNGQSRGAVLQKALEQAIARAAREGEAPPVLVYLGERETAWLEDQDIPVTVLNGNDVKHKLIPDGAQISYAAAGGILEALWPEAKGFNLLRKGLNGKAKVPRTVTLVLVFILIAAWIPYAMLPLHREEKRLAEIDRQISLRKEEVKKAEALRKEAETLAKEIATIRSFKETKPLALVVLKELTAILPKGAWLTRLRMTETTVDLEGYASSASEILPKLEQSQYFKKVEFASPTVRDTRLNADRFVVKMEIEGFMKEGGEKVKDGIKK